MSQVNIIEKLCLLFQVFLLLSSCTTMSTPHVDGSFLGLMETIKPNGKDYPERPTKIYVVHGMAPDKAPEYSIDFVELLAKETGLTVVEKTCVPLKLENIVAQVGNCSSENNRKGKCKNTITEVKKFGDLTVFSLRSNFENFDKIRVYQLRWSPAATSIKEAYLGYDLPLPVPENRADDLICGKKSEPEISNRPDGFRAKPALLNGLLKTQLMNQNFSDPVMYLGNYGTVLRKLVKQGLCFMMRDDITSASFIETRIPIQNACQNLENNKQSLISNYAFVSRSMGSSLLFDAMGDLVIQEEANRNKKSSKVYSMLSQSSHFFMLANQLPLLSLGRLKIGNNVEDENTAENFPMDFSGETGAESIFNTLNKIHEYRNDENHEQSGAAEFTLPPGSNSIDIVAFSGPNDLLSYKIPPYFQDAYGCNNPDLCKSNDIHQTSGVHFSNVTIGIATEYLGLFANPAKAHHDYLRNEKVLKMIMYGSKKNNE